MTFILIYVIFTLVHNSIVMYILRKTSCNSIFCFATPLCLFFHHKHAKIFFIPNLLNFLYNSIVWNSNHKHPPSPHKLTFQSVPSPSGSPLQFLFRHTSLRLDVAKRDAGARWQMGLVRRSSLAWRPCSILTRR